MSRVGRIWVRRVLIGVASLILLPCFLGVLWVFIAFNKTFRKCVRLENGANLGYEAVFDLRAPLWRPTVVPRLANGDPILRDSLWSTMVTPTTLYGSSMKPLGESGYDFAWRADTGLVLKAEDPAKYARLVAEAGHANWDIGTGAYGAGWLINEIAKRPDHDFEWCPTHFVTW